MVFVDRGREQRVELGLPIPRAPVFYDGNNDPVFDDGIFKPRGFRMRRMRGRSACGRVWKRAVK